ncbi:uncharacterized protein LOC113513453 [Galleria mellonella]|uniref:Uncharacterized protein LOC113513453 n=1 Tax=Galleria mellonella TaxID=7137 RepID=A0A6J1WHH4_GALME|nr:uncharacterized protein LOC113513453 [Galleria mellonella]
MELNSRQCREKLIDEVKKYPVLYDTRHESHRDIDVRDQCWHEISERLGTNSEILKREWKILRDSMRQALKRSKKGATTKSGTPCKKWRFESRMSYLLPYMTVRRNQRHIRDDIKVVETEVQSDQESEIWDPGNPTTDQDSLDLFFASVCQSTKRLPRKLQYQVKKQVLDVLLKVEEEFESGQSDTKTEVNKNF